MSGEIIIQKQQELGVLGFAGLPGIISSAGERASFRFVEFFTANIRNWNTRVSYGRAVREFCEWCEDRGLRLEALNPIIVSGYVELLDRERGYSKPSVKQHLAAIRMLFDYLVTGGVLPMNPAGSVRGPKYSIKRGKTPVLSAEEARQLLDSIETDTIIGLRDRALIGVMVYSFSRVSAAVSMRIEDYFQGGKRWKFRFLEKGGKYNEVFAHHNAEAYLDAYLDAAGIWEEKKAPLFRTIDRTLQLSDRQLHRTDALRMVKRRALAAGLPASTCNHTFRATGITTYLKNGGRVEVAQQIAGHESARTTGLYDRRDDEVSLDEVERIVI
ncbi:integrase [Bryobacterales bacterium F-183]|nr:integrase [Bryobacterales bacterium F-183]